MCGRQLRTAGGKLAAANASIIKEDLKSMTQDFTPRKQDEKSKGRNPVSSGPLRGPQSLLLPRPRLCNQFSGGRVL